MSNTAQALRLEDFDDRDEKPWKPAVGESVTGTVLDIDVRTTTWKDVTSEHPVLLLAADDDTEHVTAVWALHTVMKGELKKHRPQVGERVTITRLQNAEVGYFRYRLRVHRDTPRSFDWGGVSNIGSDGPARELPPPAAPKSPFEDDDEPLPFDR
jgi:hypothetical protein